MTKETIQAVLDNHDPIGLLADGAPNDEYLPEVNQLFSKIRTGMSAKEISTLLRDTFSEMFAEISLEASLCEAMAADLLSADLFDKSKDKQYYIVSDVHSFYTILKNTLEEKGFFEREDNVLVLLGDAFDRGSETTELGEFLLSLHEQDRLIYIRGNHEDLLVRCLQQLARGESPINIATSLHVQNGTWDTLLALAGMSEAEAVSFPQELVRRVMNSRVYRVLLPTCIDYFETERFVFTHGYLPCKESGDPLNIIYRYRKDWREADTTSWYRARWMNGVRVAVENNLKIPEKTVVCGHWHTSFFHSKYAGHGSEWGEDADFSPYHDERVGIIGIDACTAFSKKMNCLVFNSTEL